MSVAQGIWARGGWVAGRLTLVAIAALLAADGVNQWLLARWQAPAMVTPVETAPEAAETRTGPLDYRQVLARNVFNSAPVTVKRAPVARVEDNGPIKVIQPLNLNVRLTGTVVGATPAASYAFILDVAGREERLYQVGDLVLDEGLVKEIQRDKVVLTRGEAEQVLRMFETEKPAEAPRSASLAPFEGAGDQTLFAVDRGEVDEALADMPRLLTQARLLPNFRGGKTDGFRIFNIVPGSLFAKIGLKNGDVLHRVNEISIEDPTKFMEIFQQLRNENHISLDLVRGGQPTTLEYDIR